MASLTINYTIEPGQTIRIGYKPVASSGDYTYVNYYPGANESPYIISGVAFNTYEVQINTICSTCGGNKFSDPQVYTATAMS